MDAATVRYQITVSSRRNTVYHACTGRKWPAATDPTAVQRRTEVLAHLRLKLCIGELRGVDLGPSQSCRRKACEGTDVYYHRKFKHKTEDT